MTTSPIPEATPRKRVPATAFKPGHAKVGGKRRGSVNKRTRERQEATATCRLILENLTGMGAGTIETLQPLDVLRAAMAAHLKQGNWLAATQAAAPAAPYCHARLAQIDAKIQNSSVAQMSDQEMVERAVLMTQRLERAGVLPRMIEGQAVEPAPVEKAADSYSFPEPASVADPQERPPNVVDITPPPPSHGLPDFDELDRIRNSYSHRNGSSSDDAADVDIWTKM